MNANKFFYRTLVKIAVEQGHDLRSLARICNVSQTAISRHLKRSNGKGLSSWECYLLRQALAPHLTLDELFPEAREEALHRLSNLRSPSQRG